MTQFEPHWVQRPGTGVAQIRRPRTLDAALELLAEDPTRRPVAGGTDLVVELDRQRGPDIDLIDLSGVDELRWIAEQPGALMLGSMVTHNDAVSDQRVVHGALPLAQACLEVGSPQLRNRATIAGNLVTASPANDTISALMALDASVVLVRHAGTTLERRLVAVRDFFDGFRSTALAPDELVAAIHVPTLTGSQRGLWVKLGLRKAQAISVVHAGVVLDMADDGTVTSAAIALGSVAPTVVMAPDAEHALIGKRLDADSINAAAVAAAEGVEPIDDTRATAAYRVASVETVVRRALHAVAAGTHASTWPARVPTLAPRSPLPSSPEQPSGDHTASSEVVVEIGVEVNGAPVVEAAEPFTLLDWLRDQVGTGTKEGCAEGECGACTVLLDGQAIMSCLTPAAQADGGRVTTVEGLAENDRLSTVQQAFVDQFAVQCGYCIPGFVVSATALRDEIDAPTNDEIEFGLAGNLCRCTGYYAIVEAVRSVGGKVTS